MVFIVYDKPQSVMVTCVHKVDMCFLTTTTENLFGSVTLGTREIRERTII